MAASAAIIRASSASPRSAPMEQQPTPRCSAGSGPMPWQPRPHRQVHLDVRKARSKRQTVSPSWISSIPGSMATTLMGVVQRFGQRRGLEAVGTDGSVGDLVAEAVRIVRASGLPNETNATFTNIEGEWDEVMAVIKECVDTMAQARS